MTHHDTELSPAALRMAGRFRRPSLSAPEIALAVAAVDAFLLTIAAWAGLFAGSDRLAFEPVGALLAAAGAALLGVASISAAGGYQVRSLRCPAPMAPMLALLPAAGLAILMPLAGPGFSVLMADLRVPLRRGSPAGRVPGGAGVPAGLGGRVGPDASGGRCWSAAATARGRLIRGLADRPGNDVRICAIFDDRGGPRAPDLVLDVPKIGRFDELVAFARRAEIDMIVITLPPHADDLIARLMRKFAVLPVPVHLSAFTEDFAFGSGRSSGLVKMADGSFSARRRITKRALDLGIGTLALVLAAPIMALAAIAIRLEGPGPILFRQPRSGFNERTFEVLKLRTMRPEAADVAARDVVRRADDRVTRVGRFLRRSSIDELPQLVNVLRGELSLVGPRPHAVGAVSASQEPFEALVEGYSARHRLPPGITGLAQINGYRGTIEDPEQLRARVMHDLAYIENWSIWLDLKIILRTPLSLLNTDNAY